MNWYLTALKKYAVFQGRSRRKEYWFFVLFSVIISIILSIVDGVVGTFDPETGAGLLGGLYSLAVLIPSIAVTIRRLHDSDRTGWWFLIVFIPLVGFLVLLVFMFLDSTPGSNRFGSNPKDEAA